MEPETASSVDEQVGGGGGGGASVVADTRGKHRILAELKRVEQEMKFLEEELEELEKTDNLSIVCEELLRNVENIPDPLLSLTNGPANPLWDRWFEGGQDSQGCRCTIL
uniref:G protein gamma domain-containing protein n=1 Tax=Salix viminalis TaxID=40686 RepID=A0A6N2KNN8_SALVM